LNAKWRLSQNITTNATTIRAATAKRRAIDMPYEIDCWITLGSTYSYLTVMRAPQVAESSGVQVRFRPFHLLQIFKEMNYFPFCPASAPVRQIWQLEERRISGSS
jgi:2-hydroxychromene-2-carboxylate isomerase